MLENLMKSVNPVQEGVKSIVDVKVSSSQEMKATLKQFISKLGVSPKDKVECNLCWE